MQQSPRIEPLKPEAWTPEVEAIFPILVPPGAPVKGSDFNSLLVIAHHPELADPFVRFNARVSRGTVLPASLRELAVLRVAWRTQCLYEWVHHVIAGASAGLDRTHFDAVRLDQGSGRLSELEAAVVRATDEVCIDAVISDGTWAQLSRHLDKKQILELIFSVGCFQTVAALLNTARVEIEPAFLDMLKANGWPLVSSETAGETP